MEGLVELDWVGMLAEEESRMPRFVLLADPTQLSIMPSSIFCSRAAHARFASTVLARGSIGSRLGEL
jgi:hypothetical protein